MSSDLVTRIHHALDAARPIVHAVTDTQWTMPTPCVDWQVRDLVNHLVGGMAVFAELVVGHPIDHDPDVDWLGAEPATAFDRAADNDRRAWAVPGALAGTITLSFGAVPAPMAAVIHLTELVVHTIDLAVATGQEHLLDPEDADDLLATMCAMGGIDAFRVPGMFGPEKPADDTAPTHLRLLAYVGRTVTVTLPAPA
jgi:uncharacterized protein (TIGR03086 family)